MNKKLSILALCVALALPGCASKLVADPQLVKPVAVAVPQVRPMALQPLQWTVDPGTPPEFTLNQKNFKNYEANMSEIERWHSEELALVEYLTKVIQSR